MDNLNIITNNQARDLLYWWELTEREQKELDYVNPEDRGLDFFRYKGRVYDTQEFVRIELQSNRTSPFTMGVWEEDSPLLSWEGFQSDSMFSGVLIRYAEDFERVVVGLALA